MRGTGGRLDGNGCLLNITTPLGFPWLREAEGEEVPSASDWETGGD